MNEDYFNRIKKLMEQKDNYKTCWMCKKELYICPSNFYREKNNKDGFRNNCIECHKEYVIMRRLNH